MQHYTCLCDMTLEDLMVKLLTDKDPTTVLPDVIIWTTQVLFYANLMTVKSV